jgi:hypothetical protein
MGIVRHKPKFMKDIGLFVTPEKTQKSLRKIKQLLVLLNLTWYYCPIAILSNHD